MAERTVGARDCLIEYVRCMLTDFVSVFLVRCSWLVKGIVELWMMRDVGVREDCYGMMRENVS